MSPKDADRMANSVDLWVWVYTVAYLSEKFGSLNNKEEQ